MTTLELLEIINSVRETKSIKQLSHRTLMTICTSTFNSQIQKGSYLKDGKKYVLYDLTLEQVANIIFCESENVYVSIMDILKSTDIEFHNKISDLYDENRKKIIKYEECIESEIKACYGGSKKSRLNYATAQYVMKKDKRNNVSITALINISYRKKLHINVVLNDYGKLVNSYSKIAWFYDDFTVLD